MTATLRSSSQRPCQRQAVSVEEELNETLVLFSLLFLQFAYLFFFFFPIYFYLLCLLLRYLQILAPHKSRITSKMVLHHITICQCFRKSIFFLFKAPQTSQCGSSTPPLTPNQISLFLLATIMPPSFSVIISIEVAGACAAVRLFLALT